MGNDQNRRGFLRFLYATAPGRILLKPLVSRPVSELAGRLLSTRFSCLWIGGFARRNGIDLSEYRPTRYRSFNEFFCRKILPEKRPVDPDPNRFISPCDSRLTVFPATEESCFTVKGVEYTLEELLQDKALAERFNGGTVFLFRLDVTDYHRYCYSCDGTVGTPVRIPGVYHTVQPIACAHAPVYRRNTREYVSEKTENFGQILIMEVGAMLVGRIVNFPAGPVVTRGQEKGFFQFGGSTIVIVTEPGAVRTEERILKNSREGIETPVKYGEMIGRAGFPFCRSEEE